MKHQHAHLLREEAQKVFPIEACAMLFGESKQKEVIVKKVVVALNKLQSLTRFEIDPETVFRAFNGAEHRGLDLIGLFHSHPAPATPSSIDLKHMKFWGDIVWLILSSTSGDLCAYVMKNGSVKEIPIEIAGASE
ncbi:MAG: M67 family metallopeptidase [Candidatus Hodarchaeota archaeon]